MALLHRTLVGIFCLTMRAPTSLLLPLVLSLCGQLPAEDWPTVMHDNQRTGVTAEEIRPPLAPRWKFRSPFPPAKSWDPTPNGYGARKNKSDVSHDDAFRVVAVGDAVYFASSAENCVYALDAATGAVRWTFPAGAAPRLTPAFWKGKLYFGADDGIFRCVDAASGKLLWEFSAALGDQQMLGYGRFLSLWPIRAGGIVENGIAYFSAGLFPSNGLFLYALNADDGALIWRRQVDADARDEHVPEGYILARDDSFFTTARTAPARWNKADGARVEFATPFPQVKNAHEYRFYNGGTDARIANGKHIVYGSACILGYDPDLAVKDKDGRSRNGSLLFNWFNARQAAFKQDKAYLATDTHIVAVEQAKLPELANAECKEFEEAYKKLAIAPRLDYMEEYERLVKTQGADYFRARALQNGPLKYSASNWAKWPAVSDAILAKMKTKCAWMTPLSAAEALIISGNVLYIGGEDAVHALDANTGAKLWSSQTTSRVRGLAVTSGRLYVSTIDGTVRCFAPGAGETPPTQVRDPAQPNRVGEQAEPPPDAPAWKDVARTIITQAGTKRGYCLVVGKGADRLASELARAPELYVHCLMSDPKEVAAARQALARAGLYGGRVVVTHSDLKLLPFPPYLFNIAVDCAALSGGEPSAPADELFRVTKPCGGATLLHAGIGAAQLSKMPKDGIQSSVRREPWLVLKRGHLPQTQDWTHNYATPANTYCSEDASVKGPFSVLWYGEPGPRDRIERHASPPLPLIVGGTLFTIGYERVMAYDVYNGVCYWERELEGATRERLPLNTSNLAADEKSLFIVTSSRRCLRLDIRTGEPTKQYEPPRAGDYWAWVARDGALLFGSRAEVDERRKAPQQQTSNAVFALNVDTAQQAWLYEAAGIDHDGIALSGGKLFFVARGLSDAERTAALANAVKDTSVRDREPVDPKGRKFDQDLRKIVALDAQTGKPLWEKPFDCSDITLDDNVICEGRVGVACMVKDGVLVVHGTGSLGHPHKEFLAGEFARRALYAFDAATGNLLWGGRRGYMKRPIIVGDQVYAEPFAWELKTGTQRTVPNPLSGRPQTLDFHRGYIGCGHLLASATTLFGARRGISYWNLDEQTGFVPFGGMALACGLCAVPANGVFAIPEGRSGCTCDTPIHTSIVLYPDATASAWGTGFTGGLAPVNALPVKHASVNLGAQAYRQDAQGNLWIPYPARVDAGPMGKWLPTYQHAQTQCIGDETLAIANTGTPWLFTSAYASDKPLRFRMQDAGQPPVRYTVKLHFAEPLDTKPGERVFSVLLQGKEVLAGFDIVVAAGGPRRALVKEFRGVEVKDNLDIALTPSPASKIKQPLLCGFQALRE
jgi:outer membrane protein assembly factor BamB